jgi:hypothetical protein
MEIYMPSKKKIPKGKVQINPLISREIYERLIKVAVDETGKARGGISMIVERALALYLTPLARAKYTQGGTKMGLSGVYEEVINKIKEIMKIDYKPLEVPEKILDQAIALVRGSDPRTIAKWKEAFIRYGLIRYVGGAPPNRIVSLS